MQTLDIETASTERLINILACVERLGAESLAHHFGRRIAISIELESRGITDWASKVNTLMRSQMN